MRNLLLGIFITTLFTIILISTSHAALLNGNVDPNAELIVFGNDSGYNIANDTLPVMIGNTIQIILGFVGTLFLILILVSGYQWMTAGGNVTTIEAAKKRMINAVIGLAIVLAAYSIAWFVTEQVLGVTGVIELEEEVLQ